MEEKESTFSGSPGNSETESLPVTQKVSMPMAATAAVEATVSSEENYNNTPVSETTQVAEVAAAASVGLGDLSGKKKRGRPRKYDADGNLRPGYNSNNKSNKGGAVPPPPPGFYLSSPLSSEFSYSSKRGRGKPSGSGNYQILASLGKFINGKDYQYKSLNILIFGFSLCLFVWLPRKCCNRKEILTEIQDYVVGTWFGCLSVVFMFFFHIF